MDDQLQCPNGHRWSLDAAENETCPVCGNTGETLVPAQVNASPAGSDEFPPPPMGDRASAVAIENDNSAGMTPPTSEQPHNEDTESTHAAGDLSPGFGRYTIIRTLGRGGMGAVYLAHDTELDRQVALKVPHRAICASRESLERFLTEARAAATLDHPNICSVYDVGQVDGTHFLTMAYIEGQTLGALIRDNDEPLSQRGVADLIGTLAETLAEAHAHGVVHRDLKPANIMINKRCEPVVMDFGLARREGSGDSRLTAEGAIMGTPTYMSPEQVAGDQAKVGPGSDIYALGVIMYEMLTGRLPFSGSTGEVLAKIATQDPPPLAEFQPDVDPTLATICMKALSKDVSDRHASMEEFADAISAFLENAPLTTGGVDKPLAHTHGEKAIAETDRTSSLHLAAELLAKLAARIESGQLTSASQLTVSIGPRRPWWVWAAGVGALTALIVLVVLAILPNNTPAAVPVRIDVNHFTQYVNAVFILDDNEISREDLSKALDLSVGRHELVVKRNGNVVARKSFEVTEDREQPVVVAMPDPPTSGKSGTKVAGKKPSPTQTKQPDLAQHLKSIKVDPTLAITSEPRYSAKDSPFQTDVSLNGTSVGTFRTKATKSIAGNIQPGWNTIAFNTKPQIPGKSKEPMTLRIGTTLKTKNGKTKTQNLLSFYNGEHWKLKDGRYQHQLDPSAIAMPTTFHVYYAGCEREQLKPKDGDYILTGAPTYSSYNPSLTATVFVNGVPLTSFGRPSRTAVVTDLLRPGDNEIKLVTYRVENCLTKNDVRITLKGPATYDAGSGKLTYRPILWLSSGTGWKRNKTTQRLESILDPNSNRIERTLTFSLPEEIASAGRLPKKINKFFAEVHRHWSSYENSLHSNLSINGRRIGRFTSDSWESADAALKRNDWNTIVLETKSMHPGYAGNHLRFAIRPIGPKAGGEIEKKPVLWWFVNGQGWKAKDNRLYHRAGNEAVKTKLTFRLFLGEMRYENQKLAKGDYVLSGKPAWSNRIPSATSTIYVNGTPLTSFAGIARSIVLKRPLLKKGMNEIRLVTNRVENSYEDIDCRFTISGPAEYSVAAGKLVPKAVVAKFASLTGWKRDKKTLKLLNAKQPASNTLERTIRLEVK